MSKLFVNMCRKDRKVQKTIVVTGLSSAGKSTLVYRLKNEEDEEVPSMEPTIGFTREIIDFENMTLDIWDAGGQDKIHPKGRVDFTGTHGLIFVVDCSDQDRIQDATQELHQILNNPKLRDAILLVVANKQDLPNAMPASRLVGELNLQSMSDRKWFVQSACAKTGEGLNEGLRKLSSAFTSTSLPRTLSFRLSVFSGPRTRCEISSSTSPPLPVLFGSRPDRDMPKSRILNEQRLIHEAIAR